MAAWFPSTPLSVLAVSALVLSTPATAQTADCVAYATEYANSYIGSGDVVGDAVSGGMAGAVLGGAWDGVSGARRGAEAAAALGVLNNMGSMPGGWDAIYDMAMQMCMQQTSGVHTTPLDVAPNLAAPSSNCRSSASVNKPRQRTPDGGLMVGSGGNGCQ